MIQGRAGIVKWPCAIAFGLAGLIGAMFGTELAKQIDGNTLIKWFALAMIAIAATMALPRKSEGDPTIRLTLPMIWKLAPMGGLAGFAAGFFGIGGGFLIARSEEHTSELQSLMRISYAVF